MTTSRETIAASRFRGGRRRKAPEPQAAVAEAAVDAEEMLQGEESGRPAIDKKLLLTIPLLQLAVLFILPFLPREQAGPMLTYMIVAVFLVLGALDFLTLKVPNLLVYPSLVFVLAGTAIIDVSLLPQALIGGGALLGIMFVLALIGRGSMGMGDVKFACLAGCALGWRVGIAALASGFVLGALAAIGLMVLRLRGRKDVVPLTPFLAGGALIWVYLAGTLVS